MPTGVECVCCKEISKIVDKTTSEGVGCIVLHPGFQNVCLDPWVLLQTAYLLLATVMVIVDCCQ